MRKLRGFRAWDVPVGLLFLREEDDGSWVLLAGEPDIKIDNKHRDGQPHMHVNGWDSEDRCELRRDLTLADAVEAIARHLNKDGHINVKRLLEELE